MRDLQRTRFSDGYQQSLAEAWMLFGAFWNENVANTKFNDAGRRPLLLMHYLCAFVQRLYEKNPSKNLRVARHAILAVSMAVCRAGAAASRMLFSFF